MPHDWIASFKEGMRRLGRDNHFFVEPCKEHHDCVLVQIHKREEHIPWREHMAADVARTLAKLT
jgi:hypothetical protein